MIVTRFAPSPTGPLHLGHAFSALTAFEAARGGRFVLRIEDIDQTRCRPEFEAAILDDLAWLGLAWETPVRRQSEHMGAYAAALARLRAMGVLYRCFRTRAEALAAIAGAPHGSGEAYFGAPLPPAEEAERLASGEAYAWRLSIAASQRLLGARYESLMLDDDGLVRADPAALGDVVLGRKDFPASYHLAAVHDDALQGITLVVRGEDLRPAAHVHRLLQALLDFPAPRYRHHGLLRGADGKRLAKRDSAATLASLRSAGATPADVRRLAGL
jgi:glutamyl-Q tRNA(Asp) synthetase